MLRISICKPKRSTTVFLGAGAALDIGAPSTNKITDAVVATQQTFFGTTRPFIKEVNDILKTHYGKADVNFEDIFHALEQLSSYRMGWQQGTAKGFKPALGAFVKPNDEAIFQDDMILLRAKHDLVKEVATMINAYDSIYFNDATNQWHTDFWRSLANKSLLTIGTLNYDTCIDRILFKVEDGFEPTNYAFKRFSPKKLLDARDAHKILHLHGCINYGYARTNNPNEYTLTDNHEDLYWYPDYSSAKETWNGRSTYVSQSGDEALMGPLITGLHKTEKIQTVPYSYYNTALTNAICQSESLLIVGYSFGDKHFNRLLEKVARIHGSRRKVVIITWVDKKYWYPHVVKESMNHEMIVNVSQAFQDFEPFGSKKFSNPLVSKDGRARIYFSGFKDAITNQGDEIINFLSKD